MNCVARTSPMDIRALKCSCSAMVLGSLGWKARNFPVLPWTCGPTPASMTVVIFLPEFSALAEQTEQSRGANFVSVDNIHVKANKIACVNRKNIFPSAP
mmetsp:Transcript_14484/g.30473  ORF Transcript_14484/g.30473 Transcript_14484/m.30473 type:complete len:99 (+) Transcript_14484:2-298(+)